MSLLCTCTDEFDYIGFRVRVVIVTRVKNLKAKVKTKKQNWKQIASRG